MITLSNSTFTITACPWALQQKINKTPKAKSFSEALERGRSIHKVLELLGEKAKELEEITDYDLTKIVSKVDPQDVENVRIMGKIFLKKFPIDRIVLTEQKIAITRDFERCDFYDKKAAWRGIIDVVMTSDNISLPYCDHKSNWQIFNPNEKIQFKLYSWMLHKLFPKYEYIIPYVYFARYGNLVQANPVGSPMDSFRDNFNDYEQMILAKSESIWNLERKIRKLDEKGECAEAIPGDHCFVCDWHNICPLGDKNYDLLRTQEDAVDMAKEVLVKKDQIKTKSKLIKQYINKFGDLCLGNNQYYGFQTYDRRSVDLSYFLEQLRQKAHLDFLDGSKEAKRFVNNKLDALKELLDEIPELSKMLKVNVGDVSKKWENFDFEEPKTYTKLSTWEK